MPRITAARTTSTIMPMSGSPAGANFIIRAPPRAPMTMMPSRPMLMTPECSEKQPPKATRMRTEAKIMVYWISSSIMLPLLSSPGPHGAQHGGPAKR